MRTSMLKIFSVVMMGLVLLSILWVSSSTVGKVYSQVSPSQKPQMSPASVDQPVEPTMDLPPPPTDMPAIGGPPSQTEAGVPQFQNPEGYIYDPIGRRDPFRPFGQLATKITQANSDKEAVPGKPEQVPEPMEPLQLFDLAQLKVVGIIWEIRNPKAIIRDPVGKTHFVLKESKIGRNNGFVAAIREGEVIVVEPAATDDGMRTANTRVMTLYRK